MAFWVNSSYCTAFRTWLRRPLASAQVSADLTPLSANKVAVQFRTFKLLGLISITAPPSAKGESPG